MPLGARITGSDWIEGGLMADDAVVLAQALKNAGFDYLCVSSGGITAEVMRGGTGDGRQRLAGVNIPFGPGYQVPFAEKVRREAGIATRAVGLIATAQQAEAIVAEGKADMIALARAMLDDPRWGWHAAQALGGEVKRPPQIRARGPEAVAGSRLSRLTCSRPCGARETVEVRMVGSVTFAMLSVVELCASIDAA